MTSLTLMAALVLASCSLALPARACSIAPAFEVPGSRFIGPPNSKAAPTHLPADAAGVLYSAFSDKMRPAEFSIVEQGSALPLPVQLNAIAQRALAGLDLTLYRVGPRGGFQVGKKYKISKSAAPGDATYVLIDPATIARSLDKITLAFPAPPNRETMFHGDGCGQFYGASESVFQRLAYRLPADLLPYRALIFSHVHRQSGVLWQSMLEEKEDAYDRAILLRRAGFGLGETVHAADLEQYRKGNGRGTLTAKIAFFEVDDAWHDTAPAQFVHAPAKLEANDSLDLLRKALAGKNLVQIRAELDATPVRWADARFEGQSSQFIDGKTRELGFALWRDLVEESRFSARRRELIAQLGALLHHADVGVRISAVHALARAGDYANLDVPVAHKILANLRPALNDPAPPVRTAARLSLAAVRQSVTVRGLACSTNNTWQFSCIHPASFDSD